MRIWKVVNLADTDDAKGLPVVSRAEPFAPGSSRAPQEDWIVTWVRNGDIVKQVGHSKKVRGHMVMPVRVLRDESAIAAELAGEGEDPCAEAEEGWVTRRHVDSGASWFEEIAGHAEVQPQ